MMARKIYSGVVALVLFHLVGPAEQAAAQAEVEVRGGNQTLNITTGSAGSEPIAVVNSLSTLRYRRPSVVSKITVQTSCPSQAFSLSIVATGVVQGVAAPAVDLVDNMAATNCITSIPTSGFGIVTVTLLYTATATFAQGNSTDQGDDVHTVTYTILAQ